MLKTIIYSATSLCLSSSLVPLAGLPAFALPTGGSVISGEVQITPHSDHRLDINQSSHRAIIHWDTFNLSEGHHIFFHHPSGDAATLNRVLGNTPSSIAGQINALGTVLILNPNGILFTETALIDVGGLLATSLSVNEQDFISGLPLTLGAVGTPGNVVNRGQITVREGGYAALVAPQVANQGVILARLGRIDLAAGSQATLDLYGDGLLSLTIDPALAANNPDIAALIAHSGTLSADGGQVWLSAAAGAAVLNQVINTTGIIEAQQVDQQGGRIVLSGGDGTIALGGRVNAEGGQVNISSAALNVSSEIGVPRGVGSGAADTTVMLNLGTATQEGRLEIQESGFLRVRELSLDSPHLTGVGIAIANTRADGLHSTVLHLNTGITVENYGFNPSTIVNVALGSSIQSGVNAVANGGTVNLAAGTHTEGTTLTLANRTLTLRGTGANTTAISGANSYQIFNISGTSDVTFDGLTLQAGHQLPGSGGAIFAGTGSTVTINNSALVGNHANGLGGGIYVGAGSTVTLFNSNLSANTAENAANNGAGGALLNDGGTVRITNSTLSGNQANYGGALRNQNNGIVTITNSTLTGNLGTHPTSAISTGGIRIASGTVTVTNSIVAGNSAHANNAPQEVSGPLISGGHNLVGTNGNAGGFPAIASDIVLPGAIATALGPLANNGGPTQTHALVPGSPAIDAGSNGAVSPEVTTDQREFGSRIVGAAVDIGAYEFGAAPSIAPAPNATPAPFRTGVAVVGPQPCQVPTALPEALEIPREEEFTALKVCGSMAIQRSQPPRSRTNAPPY
ncbi:choice-of-anchor Q domain-containing protein [Leptolyngbya sp. PCC 6406]|uniref:two-partner secretion domain-containing protein n=1 Tax=Leptolyngbya sp. PCC 6406 TaxID=1173264 RepID=UPI0002ABF484|nr:choice-of-anchor Q domain-containing protein [Leptolyngbya sp. PCC 6406]